MHRKKYKLKRLSLQIDYRDPLDLKQSIIEVLKRIENGQPYFETNVLSANIVCNFEFIEQSEFEEKQINGVWYRVIKNKI